MSKIKRPELGEEFKAQDGSVGLAGLLWLLIIVLVCPNWFK